jgi:hypothetical protein
LRVCSTLGKECSTDPWRQAKDGRSPTGPLIVSQIAPQKSVRFWMLKDLYRKGEPSFVMESSLLPIPVWSLACTYPRSIVPFRINDEWKFRRMRLVQAVPGRSPAVRSLNQSKNRNLIVRHTTRSCKPYFDTLRVVP